MALSSVEELDGFATPSPYSTSATGSDIWDDVSVNRPQDDPVVIVGIGCRLPGDNSTPAKVKDFLEKNKSAQGRWPASRLNIDGFHHPDRDRHGTLNADGGYFLDQDLHLFDNDFFSINNVESTRMDAQQKKLLEVVYECFENSGTRLDDISGTNVGCYVGNFLVDHNSNLLMDPEYLNPYVSTGISPTILANRISHAFNLLGPSVVVDTACSSSIYALHLACQALRNGECQSAIVAAVNLVQSIPNHLATLKSGVLSATSTCHSFDTSADGYGRADGVNAIHIKRLSAALRDGDRIRAVIRGSAVNANGKTPGISQPKSETQALVIKAAYANAGLRMDETAYIECHGTGTAVGDPIELRGVAMAFDRTTSSQKTLRFGSVKTNFGHSEAASGLTSVIKAVMIFESNSIPATVGIQNLNPKLRTELYNMEVVRENTAWPADYSHQRISINSFGFGGANAHAILESKASYLDEMRGETLGHESCELSSRSTFLLPFSASGTNSLLKLKDAYASFAQNVATNPFVFEMSARRTLSHRQRGFIVARDSEIATSFAEAPLQTAAHPARPPPELAFVFTGQGAQWPGMGKELFDEFESFTRTIEKLDLVLQSLPDPPSWTIKEAICAPKETSQLHTAAFSQPVCTALQVGILSILNDFGIKPRGIIGHSSGEIAAAVAAGALTPEEAIICAYYRGKCVSETHSDGAMLAVQLTLDEAHAIIKETDTEGKVVCACLNSPTSITMSGDRDGIEVIQATLKSRDKFARLLPTGGKAYHSHHMNSIGASYCEKLRLHLGRHSIPSSGIRFISTTRNEHVTTTIDPSYWHKNADSPVLFAPGIKTLFDGHEYHLVEIGPHSTLAMPIKDTIKALSSQPTQFAYFSALTRNLNSVECLLKLAGNLFLAGHHVNMKAVNGFSARQPRFPSLPDLPSYPWNYESSVPVEESRWLREYRMRKSLRHDLIGTERFGGSGRDRTWRNMLSVKDVAWLQDHKLGQTIIFPAAGYCAMAIEAATQCCEKQKSDILQIELTDVVISSPLQLLENKNARGVEIFTHIDTKGQSSFAFQIRSVRDDEALTHAYGNVKLHLDRDTTRELFSTIKFGQSTVEHSISHTGFYEALSEQGLYFGDSFRSVHDVKSHVSDSDAPIASAWTSARREHDGMFAGESSYPIHPITLDALLQSSIGATCHGKLQDMKASVPTFIGSLLIENKRVAAARCERYTIAAKASVHEYSQTTIEADLLGPEDAVVAQIVDVRLAAFNGAQFEATPAERIPFAKLRWAPDAILNKDLKLRENVISQYREPRAIRYALDLLLHKSPSLKILELFSTDPLEAASSSLVDACRGATLKPYANHTLARLNSENGQLEEWSTQYSSYVPVKTVDFDLVVSLEESCIRQVRHAITDGLLENIKDALLLTKDEYINSGVERLVTFDMDEAMDVRPFLGHFGPALSDVNKFETLHLVSSSETADNAMILAITRRLEELGHSVVPMSMKSSDAEQLPTGSTVVFLAELVKPMLITVTEAEMQWLQGMFQRSEKLIWITGGDVLGGHSPESALVQGLSRTVRLEQPELQFYTLNLDIGDINTRRLGSHISMILNQSKIFEVDHEFVLRGQALHVSRILPDEGLNSIYRQKEGLEVSRKPLRDCFDERLKMTVPGWSNSLRFVHDTGADRKPLPHEVTIAIKYAGLTAWNVAVLQGRAMEVLDRPVSQFTGVIVEVGSAVHHLSRGDRVVALAHVQLQRNVILPAKACQKVLKLEDLAEMSMVPVPYCTAMHALGDRIKLQPNETVLIHYAGDDAELAAIKLAQSLNARTFVITNTKEEEEFIKFTCPYAAERVFSILHPSLQAFLSDFTGGEGFDALVTSRPQLLTRPIWKSVSSCGRCAFLDIGPADNTHTDNSQWPCNASITKVSIGHLLSCPCENHQTRLHQLLKGVLALCRLDEISFARPFAHIDVSELISKVDRLPKSQPNPRLALALDRGDSMVEISPARYATKFDPSRAYLMVGCLGGLGRALSAWMLSRGARRFIFLGRSGLDRKPARDLVAALTADGAKVDVVRGDVGSYSDVLRFFRTATEPIAGVVQAAMGLKESIFSKMTAEAWHTAVEPKCKGTLNLHNGLRKLNINPEFFLLFSSLNGSIGAITESNYCAANAFLDAFARYRRRLGLPCTAVGLGAISGVGYVADNPEVEAHFLRRGIRSLNEAELLQVIDIALSSSTASDSQMTPDVFDPLATSHVLTGLEPLDAQVRHLHNLPPKNPIVGDNRACLWSKVYAASTETTAADTDTGLSSIQRHIGDAMKVAGGDLAAAAALGFDGADAKVRDLLTQGLAELIVKKVEELESTRLISQYGMDSMLAVEYRTWMYRVFKVDIPLMNVVSAQATIATLSGNVCETIAKAFVKE